MSQLKIYNTLTKQLEEFQTLEPNKAKIYVCGPTVYDHAHLGHARCYIIWDVITRYLRFRGYDVTYVRNITDVDDKIIKKAKEQNVSTEVITQEHIKAFEDDMYILNIAKPDIEPKATEYITEMINLSEKLIEKGHAYEKDGDVFFRVGSYEKYGELGNKNINDLMSGARVETDSRKENPLDFALWKSVKVDDEVTWDSPWGKGRPGWHTECCAMIFKLLGETIDIHAGGYDLTFPHHENERAQAECLSDKTFVKYWMHNGFVNVESEKMSKSLDNFKTIRELSETFDSNTIRLFILTNHYRMPVDFRYKALDSAKAGIKKIKNALKTASIFLTDKQVSKEAAEEVANKIICELIKSDLPENNNEDLAEISKTFCTDDICASSPWAKSEFSSLIWRVKEFINSMDNDFNTSKALAILFDLASMIQKNRNSIEQGKKINTDIINLMTLETIVLEKLADVLGFRFDLKEKELDDSNQIASQLMEIIINVRKQARTEKNWAMADLIRDQLKDIKIILKDSKDGTTTWQLEDE